MNSTCTQPKTKSHAGVVIFVGFLGVSSGFDIAIWLIRAGFHAATPVALALYVFDLFLTIGALLVVLSYRKPNLELILNCFFGLYFVKFAFKTLANHDYWFFGISVLLVTIAWLISRSRDTKTLETPHA